MEIKFELTEVQEKALQEILVFAKLKDSNEMAKAVMINFIIQNKQKLIAEELK